MFQTFDRMRWLTLSVLAATTALAGCAGVGLGPVVPGQSSDPIIRRMGAPTARYALPDGGSRLEFARGPFGKQTYMVDVDRAGLVLRTSQVLVERNFDAIKPGMSANDLLVALGTPSHRRHGGWQGGEVWSYRYEAVFCQWFQVSMVNAAVRDASYGPDPLCEIDRDPVASLQLRAK